jgi:hypothetical protein
MPHDDYENIPFDWELYESLELEEQVSYSNFILKLSYLVPEERVDLNLPFHYGCIRVPDSDELVVVFDPSDTLPFTPLTLETKGGLSFAKIEDEK